MGVGGQGQLRGVRQLLGRELRRVDRNVAHDQAAGALPHRLRLLLLRVEEPDRDRVAVIHQRRVRLDRLAGAAGLEDTGQRADGPVGQSLAFQGLTALAGGGGRRGLREGLPRLRLQTEPEGLQVLVLRQLSAPLVDDPERDAQMVGDLRPVEVVGGEGTPTMRFSSRAMVTVSGSCSGTAASRKRFAKFGAGT